MALRERQTLRRQRIQERRSRMFIPKKANVVRAQAIYGNQD